MSERSNVLQYLMMASPFILFVALVFWGSIPQMMDNQNPVDVVYMYNFDEAPKNATHCKFYYTFLTGTTGLEDYRYGLPEFYSRTTHLEPYKIYLTHIKHDGVLRITYTYFQEVVTQKKGVTYTELVELFSGVKDVEINPWGKP